MIIYITAVHMASGGSRHEHIESVKWRDAVTGNTGGSQTGAIVTWLSASGNFARVQNGTGYVAVGTVKASVPYIRTYADAKWSDNLLALPRF